MRERISGLLLLLSIPLITGCLGGQKFTGPSWTTKVTVPLIMREKLAGSQIELGNLTNDLGEAGLALNGKSLNSYDFATESWTSEQLGTKTINISGGAIPNLSISGLGVPLILGTYPINNNTSSFQLSNNDSYTSITLSNNLNNMINITLTEIVAGDQGLTLALWDDDANTAISTTTIAQGNSNGTLSLLSRTLNPAHHFSMKVTGNFDLIGTNDPKIVFDVNALEINSFTLAGSSISNQLNFDLTQALDFTFEMPQDLEMALSAASLKITPTMPANLTIGTTLTLTPLDKNDVALGIPQTINLTGANLLVANQEKNVDLKNALNTVLATKPAKLRFSASNSSIAGVAGQNVTITATDTIGISFSLNMGLEVASTTPSSSAVSDDTNMDLIQSVKLVVQNVNHSPIGLDLVLTLYPDNDQNPDNSPPTPGVNKVEFPITIAPNATQAAMLQISKAQYQNLIQNKSICHQITITNTSGNDLIANTDYLELRARVEVEVLVSKKE